MLLPTHSSMRVCCGVADVQYLLLHSNMSVWLGAVLSADRPNQPLCAVLLFILGSHLLLPCPRAGLRNAELEHVGLAVQSTQTLVQSLFKRQELQPWILPLGTWTSSSDCQDVSLMLSLNFFFLTLSHYSLSLTDSCLCITNVSILPVYEEYRQPCVRLRLGV